MPRIFQMADDFAERFAFEPSRVSGIVKALRDAGLIKAGPRGVNAPDATPLDAARILIALMLRVKHHEVAEGVQLFGQFPLFDPVEGEARPPSPPMFEEALARLIERSGHEDAPEEADRHFSVSIDRDRCMGLVEFDLLASEDDPRWEDGDFDGVDRVIQYRYLHPEYVKSLADDATPTAELLAAWRHYRTGFHEVPRLLKSDLIEIGQVLAGRKPPLEPGS